MELWDTSDVERRGGGHYAYLLVYAGSVLVLHYLFVLNRWLGIILSAVLVFYCLAGTTLINEVRQVFGCGSFFGGRKKAGFPYCRA